MATKDTPLAVFSSKPLASEINPVDLIHQSTNFYSFPEFMGKKECCSQE